MTNIYMTTEEFFATAEKLDNQVQDLAEILMNDFDVNEETIEIITSINGWNEQTMKDILYVVSGYRDFDQLYEE